MRIRSEKEWQGRENGVKDLGIVLRVTELFPSGSPLRDWRTGLSLSQRPGERRALPAKECLLFSPCGGTQEREKEAAVNVGAEKVEETLESESRRHRAAGEGRVEASLLFVAQQRCGGNSVRYI